MSGTPSDALNAQSAAQLLIQNEVSYADFAEHQRSTVDHLITLGVLEDTGTAGAQPGQSVSRSAAREAASSALLVASTTR
jgi:hypothetical protein